jgi:BirA family transcriptional regulator, biotin operon repressor / biotin---[acetyl-CoA-carboxylase] ligase
VGRIALDPDRLRAALGPRWARIEIVAETTSTNADLLADPAAPDRAVLVAEHQVAGRGRFDRPWTSPARSGLTFSAGFRLDLPMPVWGWLPLLTGVALHEAVAEQTGVAARLKWPNDLLAAPSGGKLAGILVQTNGPVAVVGIGLNVDATRAELPVDTATSLALCGATELDRTDLLAAILTRLDARVAQWVDCGGDAAACGLTAAYRAACATLGQPVRVALTGDAALVGEAVDVDELGRLVVHAAGGRDHVVAAGDVEHLRPA